MFVSCSFLSHGWGPLASGIWPQGCTWKLLCSSFGSVYYSPYIRTEVIANKELHRSPQAVYSDPRGATPASGIDSVGTRPAIARHPAGRPDARVQGGILSEPRLLSRELYRTTL